MVRCRSARTMTWGAAVGMVGVVGGCAGHPFSVADVCTEPDAKTVCWEALGLEGRTITALEQTPWGLFAGVEGEGVFHFDAETGTWASFGLAWGYVRDLAFLDTEPPRLMVALQEEPDSGTVYLTDDAGRSWKRSDQGIGKAWAAKPAFAPDNALTVDPADPQHVILSMGTWAQVYETETAGAPWELLLGSRDTDGGSINAVGIASAFGNDVWVAGWDAVGVPVMARSLDGGTTWEVWNRLQRVIPQVYHFARHPSRAAEIWVGAVSGVYASADTGRTWRHVLRDAEIRVTKVLFDGSVGYGAARRHKSGNLYASDTVALYLSQDAGSTWIELPVPSDVRGASTMTLDDRGHPILGTAGSGVWRVRIALP